MSLDARASALVLYSAATTGIVFKQPASTERFFDLRTKLQRIQRFIFRHFERTHRIPATKHTLTPVGV